MNTNPLTPPTCPTCGHALETVLVTDPATGEVISATWTDHMAHSAGRIMRSRRPTTPATQAAARANGRKGGRPRNTRPDAE
jgi:hypothetical protein